MLENRVEVLQKLVDHFSAETKRLLKTPCQPPDVQKILLRAYHLELPAEYLSLGYPPVPDASLPELHFNDWHYFRNMSWCTDEKEKKKAENIANYYFDDAVEVEDFKISSVHALINGLSVPHPPGPVTTTRPSCFDVIPRHWSHFTVTNLPSPVRSPIHWGRDRSRSPVRGKRPSTPCPYEDATTVDNSEGYEIVPVNRNDVDVIGPSSYHE